MDSDNSLRKGLTMNMQTALMTGTSGVYKTQYAYEDITVKLFTSPEIEAANVTEYQVIVTYRNGDKIRQELDTLDRKQKEYCKGYAMQVSHDNGEPAFGPLHKSYMAQAYWQLIQ